MYGLLYKEQRAVCLEEMIVSYHQKQGKASFFTTSNDKQQYLESSQRIISAKQESRIQILGKSLSDHDLSGPKESTTLAASAPRAIEPPMTPSKPKWLSHLSKSTMQTTMHTCDAS